MKTTVLRTWRAVCASLLTAAATVTSLADTPKTSASMPQRTYTGTVVSVDLQKHVLEVRGPWILKKSFILGDSCSFSFLDDRSTASDGLHAGQKVSVSYQNASGVLVADRVEQEPMRHEGTVKTIDRQRHILTLHERGMDKTFDLPADCKVVLRDDKSGTLADVQPGHRVTVTYETPKGLPVAEVIAQTSDTFTGALVAIDLTDRTVKAKAAFGSKEFHLADGCVILLNHKADAELRDLKPGDRLTFSYDQVNGVNVVNRIATATESPGTKKAGSNK